MSRETPLNHLNRPAYFRLHILFSIFLFPSFRSPAKSFPWWWRVVFASSVDTVSSLSLTFLFFPKALLLCCSLDFPWWNEQIVLFCSFIFLSYSVYHFCSFSTSQCFQVCFFFFFKESEDWTQLSPNFIYYLFHIPFITCVMENLEISGNLGISKICIFFWLCSVQNIW